VYSAIVLNGSGRVGILRIALLTSARLTRRRSGATRWMKAQAGSKFVVMWVSMRFRQPSAAVLRPFGLSYELALPLMVILDPIASMVRAMVNVALNSQIAALAGAREDTAVAAVPAPAE